MSPVVKMTLEQKLRGVMPVVGFEAAGTEMLRTQESSMAGGGWHRGRLHGSPRLEAGGGPGVTLSETGAVGGLGAELCVV